MQITNPENKIFQSFGSFAKQLQLWRSNQNILVFTNGCFDLLHKGHADSLYKASLYGDKLIVGLNTDRSVRKLKGDDRPIFDEKSRAMLLASLSVVDAVVLFEEDTPYDLIRQILPDVLVKGNDYIPEQIVGADLVLASGGKVETIELTPGFSSSEIIKRIKE